VGKPAFYFNFTATFWYAAFTWEKGVEWCAKLRMNLWKLETSAEIAYIGSQMGAGFIYWLGARYNSTARQYLW
jgi:serine acetyltransferase